MVLALMIGINMMKISKRKFDFDQFVEQALCESLQG